MAINECEITDFSLLFLVSCNSKETAAVSQKQENTFCFLSYCYYKPSRLFKGTYKRTRKTGKELALNRPKEIRGGG